MKKFFLNIYLIIQFVLLFPLLTSGLLLNVMWIASTEIYINEHLKINYNNILDTGLLLIILLIVLTIYIIMLFTCFNSIKSNFKLLKNKKLTIMNIWCIFLAIIVYAYGLITFKLVFHT